MVIAMLPRMPEFREKLVVLYCPACEPFRRRLGPDSITENLTLTEAYDRVEADHRLDKAFRKLLAEHQRHDTPALQALARLYGDATNEADYKRRFCFQCRQRSTVRTAEILSHGFTRSEQISLLEQEFLARHAWHDAGHPQPQKEEDNG